MPSFGISVKIEIGLICFIQGRSLIQSRTGMPERVLIIDDDIETLRLVGLMLQRQGYDILAASSGNNGLSVARSEKPDLIVLDVMMPDLDGYQVARAIRADAEISAIPILLFTARSQVEDKVAGYEAGADDIMTKPVHPAELVAKIKGLLARVRTRPPAAAPAPTVPRGHMIGVLAAKGGLGVSTLTLNLSIQFQKISKKEVIAAETRPGQGTWAIELGLPNVSHLNDLLRKRPSEITSAAIEAQLAKTAFHVRLLLASCLPKDAQDQVNIPQLEALVNNLAYCAAYNFLDIGTISTPGYDKIVNACDELVLLCEAHPATVRRTRILLDELINYGFGKTRLVNLVLFHRARAEMSLKVQQVQEMLDLPVAVLIPPAPELSFEAATRNQPMVTTMPDGWVAQQIMRLAETIHSHYSA